MTADYERRQFERSDPTVHTFAKAVARLPDSARTVSEVEIDSLADYTGGQFIKGSVSDSKPLLKEGPTLLVLVSIPRKNLALIAPTLTPLSLSSTLAVEGLAIALYYPFASVASIALPLVTVDKDCGSPLRVKDSLRP